MHIKPADRDSASAGASHSDRLLKEPSSLRKIRLGGSAARVPSSKETTESSLRVFVSAIGQSIGVRTPLRKQSTSTPTAKNEAASCSTPASTRRTAASSHTPVKQSTSARVTVTASTPRRSALSSAHSSSSIASSTPLKKQSRSVPSSQTPVSKRPSSASSSSVSTGRSSNNPTTPIASRKVTTMPPRTPTGTARSQNNPTTPVSNYSFIPTPAKKQGAPSTPISRQAPNSSIPRKQLNPTTPVSRQASVPPTTPVDGYNNARTPLNTHGSNIPFYTPRTTTIAGKSSLPSPLQPRDMNVPVESSRRLHFGINLSAMVEHENMGLCTPRAPSSTTLDATYSFDKNRLAQIKARRNAFQKLLTSPAQRVRVHDSTHISLTPRRPEVGDENSEPARDNRHSEVAAMHSPTRRRVANSLF